MKYILNIKNNRTLSLFFLILLITPQLFSNPFYSSTNTKIDKTGEYCEDITEITSTDDSSFLPKSVLSGVGSETNIKAQKNLRDKIADLFSNIKKATGHEKNKIILILLLTAFLYGIVHALGPGHRKTIVFSMYFARKAPWYEPLITGLILAVLHGGCSIVLILIYRGVAGPIAANTNRPAIYLEGFSYGILIILAAFMIIRETYDFIKSKKANIEKIDCSKIKLIPFFISGIYPCPGAILIMVLSFTMGLLRFGIYAVISMSFGMAIVIITVAYLAWFGRKSILIFSQKNKIKIQNISFVIEITGYVILLVFSLYVSMPFLVSLIQ